jgi:hypothetical protein
VSSGWAASPAAIDSGESRSRHGLYTFPSMGGGFMQMTIVSTFPFGADQVRWSRPIAHG